MSNGLGPWWFPEWLRSYLTCLSSMFFDEAAWEKHDIGYERGRPSRAECDKKFFQAMLRDASRTQSMSKIWICCWLATFFWIMVRLFGWTSYNRKKVKKVVDSDDSLV